MAYKSILLLGSNLGDRLDVLKKARKQIDTNLGTLIQSSSIYETGAWGIEDQPAFLNQVVIINTALNPHQLLQSINKIEHELGRIRHQKWGERLIDIDILYYDKSIINTHKLTIPHAEIANRAFTLVPLVEIIPNYRHPLLDKTQTELLEKCKDALEVKKFN